MVQCLCEERSEKDSWSQHDSQTCKTSRYPARTPTLRRPSIDNVQDHELTRLMVDHFSFEKLQQVIFQNKNQISYILYHSTKTHSFHNVKQVASDAGKSTVCSVCSSTYLEGEECI